MVGNGFGVKVGGGVGGGDEGGRFLDILQAMQIDQSPLYVSQGFGIGVGCSGGGGLESKIGTSPYRRGGLQRGRKRQVKSSSPYWPRSEFGGPCGHVFLYARPNRREGGRIMLLVEEYSVRGGG